MKLPVFILVTAAVQLVLSLNAGAQTSEAEARVRLRQDLNVKLDNSCKLAERIGKDGTGPFEQIDRCQESDYVGKKQVTGTVYRVVDGDTIHFYSGGKLLGIRMLGIDTPELHFRALAQPKWGVQARDSLASMVQKGDVITLELDQVRCDHYGRILGHVFKGKLNVNFEQIRRGYAANYCIAPNMKHCNAYAMGYLKAAQERIRIHKDPCMVTPYVWRRAFTGVPMDKKVKDSRDGSVYSPNDYYLVPVAYRIFYP